MKEKINTHIKEHKEIYLVLGATIITAGISYAIMRSNILNDDKARISGHRFMIKPAYRAMDLQISESFNNNIVNVIPKEGRGHPGYLTRCVENGLTWTNQTKAAIANGVHPTRMSHHLNGRTPDIKGLHFERLQMAS